MAPKPAETGNQEISAFFKPKPAPAPKRPALSEPDVLVLADSDDDDEQLDEGLVSKAGSSRSNKKVKLDHDQFSSQFRPIASTSKLPSATSLAGATPRSSSAASNSSPSRMLNFAYTPRDPDGAPPEPVQLSQADQARREAFIKRLSLGKDLLQKRSSYLQQDHYMASNPYDGERSPHAGVSEGDLEEAEDGMTGEDDEYDSSDSGSVMGKNKGKAIAKGKGKSLANDNPAFSSSRFANFAAKGSTSKSGSSKDWSASIKYTPLEKQILALKKENPGVVLLVEVGYKFRFFEEDAQTASRVLNIACFPSQHMLTASIPTHRLDIHVRRLLSAGYKVGVVRQQETAALKKASDNRSAPFTRALSALYTSATYVDELGVDPLGAAGTSTATLMCLVEDQPKGKAGNAKVRLGMIAVMPSTGEVVYDEFEDGLMRSELETRMLHLQPSELLLQKDLTSASESMVKYLAGQHNAGVPGFTCRIDRIPKRSSTSQAMSAITEFYVSAKKRRRREAKKQPSEIMPDSDENDYDQPVDSQTPQISSEGVLGLPKLVLVALSSLISHLSAFGLDALFLHTTSFTPFSSRASMTLNGNTIANLELLRNSTDFKEQGSLIHVLDKCKTAMGKRLLRKWISKPLVSVQAVNDRLDAIGAIHSASSSLTLSKLRDLLRTLPDLERGLARIHFGRASPNELLRMLEALQRVGSVFDEVDSPDEDDDAMDADGPVRKGAGGGLKSSVLKGVVKQLPRIKKTVEGLLDQLEVKMARDNNKEGLFAKEEDWPELKGCKDRRADVEAEIQGELKSARKILRKPALQFKKVSQEDYLYEVKVAEAKKIVPTDWIRINGTKAFYRYRSPTLQKKIQELEQANERVAAAAAAAYLALLQEVASHYELFRTVITSLATADCLFSLAAVALSSNYVRPTIVTDAGKLEVLDGRHPIIEAVSSEAFVPNSVEFGSGKRHQMILTGLNMGGKSSLSKSIALIALMAQIGSYVPAESCVSSLFDGIYTRMGANDEIARGRSTFMVELTEASQILRLATPRSLIILDELGRGTSTNDGEAIASAVLEYIVREKKSTCCFVTHYPNVAVLAKRFPESVTTNHMACLETPLPSGHAEVTFLYKLADGLASASHGLNVARLAELPSSVLDTALRKSQELARAVEHRTAERRVDRLGEILRRVKGLLLLADREGDGTGAGDREEQTREKAKLLELCQTALQCVA
ncbi:hypothetical protein JCM1841_005854 [Sporobolomyces salmonicolor]